MGKKLKGFEAAMTRRMDRSHGQWVGMLCLAFGAVFVLLAVQEGCYSTSPRLSATVLEKVYRRGTPGVGRASSGSNSRHSVKYRFTTPDGQTKEHWTRVLPATYRALNAGDTIEIQYLRSAADSRIPGQTASAPTFFAIATVLICLGLYLRRKPA